MKEINNIDTDLPINKWLREKRSDRNILITTRLNHKSTDKGYKDNLNEDLTSQLDNIFDIMGVWDMSDMRNPKLLWRREGLVTEERFLSEYNKVFNNNVDWSNSSKEKYSVYCAYNHSMVSIDSTYTCREAFQRYIEDYEKAKEFIEEYELEIRKYLFGLESEEK